MVDVGLVMKVIEPIWHEKTETASRVRQRIEKVLDWAKVRQYRTGDNPARWKGHIDHLLPKQGVGRIYQQTFVDTYSKVAFAKLYTTKTPITAADMLNDKVLPYFEKHELPMLRILTDRGTEYCGRVDHHDYQLYLAINDIDHTKTKAMSPQTNGICERFHKTILNEFYQVTFRKKLYADMEELQKDLDEWMEYYNNDRTHQGKKCCGRTPLETLLDGKSIWAKKNLAQI